MIVEIVLLLAFGFLLLYWMVSRNYDYWAVRNVAYVAPSFPFGNIKEAMLMRTTVGELYDRIYWAEPGEPMVGFFKWGQPVLLVREPELVKTVLVSDFHKFADNDFQVRLGLDPLMGRNPFVTKAGRWKQVRGVVAPALSPAKLKLMVPDILALSRHLADHIRSLNQQPVEARALCGRYTMDTVAACCFGIQANSFGPDSSPFKEVTEGAVFGQELWGNLAILCATFCPRVADLLNLRVFDKKMEAFFVKMVKEVAEHRLQNKVERSDLMQALINANQEAGREVYSLVEMAGHCMTFYLDGYETSSAGLSFVLWELAKDAGCQRRLRAELRHLRRHPEHLTYENLSTLKYLDMVVSEALRLHPPIQMLGKLCTEATELGSGDRLVRLEPGAAVAVPSLSLHYDPKYYPDPFKFDPERFAEPNTSLRTKYTYLPFGEGPRTCLGFRFALLQIKLALIQLVNEFTFEPAGGVQDPLILNEKVAFIRTARDGLWIQFTPVELDQ